MAFAGSSAAFLLPSQARPRPCSASVLRPRLPAFAGPGPLGRSVPDTGPFRAASPRHQLRPRTAHSLLVPRHGKPSRLVLRARAAADSPIPDGDFPATSPPEDEAPAGFDTENACESTADVSATLAEPTSRGLIPSSSLLSALSREDHEESLVSASGILQLDDGSLSEPESASFVVHHLKRKEQSEARFQPASRFAAFFASLRPSKRLLDTVLLGSLFAIWYWANTAFNVYNKQVLKVFPFPLTCTLIQFFVASVVMGSLWLLRLKETPRLTKSLLRGIVPLGVLHAAGFLLTNMSLGKVSVAFTHTVKSTEPFFSVVLTPSILGVIPTWGIVVSLFPIVFGVVLASATELSFNWIGFLSAVGSNIALQSRNVLSKKLMNGGEMSGKPAMERSRNNMGSGSGRQSTPLTKDGVYAQAIMPIPFFGGSKSKSSSESDILEMALEEELSVKQLDNINLFATMTVMAFFMLLPVSVVLEGSPLMGPYAAKAVTGMSSAMLLRKLGLGGVCRCLDVLSSYMILQRVSPVTHSVGNCVKRAVVIAFSIVVFKTKMTLFNIVGTLLALAGVFVYSVIVSACKQNYFGPDSAVCKPIYEPEVELVEGAGI